MANWLAHATIAPSILCLLVLPTPISGQGVNWSDLEGVTVEADVHRNQEMQRGGRTATVKAHQHWKFSIGPDKSIDVRVDTTFQTPRGTRKDKPNIGKFSLDEPRAVPSRGGGDAVWKFADGTLTFLRTFPSGAYRAHFAFARGESSLTCTIAEAFARQDGNRPIKVISPSGEEMTLISAKTVSSVCKARKR